jgi:hypothetical protein
VFIEPLLSSGHMRHNMKMELKEIARERVNWINLAQDWN